MGLSLLRIALHAGIFALLTVLTQIGGMAWVLALFMRRRIVGFLTLYILLSVATLFVAPLFGRVAVTCWRDGPLQVQSWAYCAMNRTYMVPELVEVLDDAAGDVAQARPGTVTLLLDAGFPFGDGFPLLPHLSHSDGRRADLAFFYQDETGYLPGRARSPIGYFAFEQGPTACPKVWPTMRWEMGWLQPAFPDVTLEPERTRSLVSALASDGRVSRLFLEPHLVQSLGLSSEKIRFQGCRAARHDDHIHVDLR